MIFSNSLLSPADWKLLDQMGTALTNNSGTQVIKLRPLPAVCLAIASRAD